MCHHTATYVSSYWYICVRVLLHVCARTAAGATYVSTSCYMCVLIRSSSLLWHMCTRTATCVYSSMILLHVSSYCYVCLHMCAYCSCVLILVHMCPHTGTYVSSYWYICVCSVSLYASTTCPCSYYYSCHTTIHMSSYWYICVLLLVYICPHTTIRVIVLSSCYDTCVLILL